MVGEGHARAGYAHEPEKVFHIARPWWQVGVSKLYAATSRQ